MATNEGAAGELSDEVITVGGQRLPLWKRLKPYGPTLGAAAAIALLFLLGVMKPSDLKVASRVMWRPVLTIASIMVTTAAAQRLGVMDRIAAALFVRAKGSAPTLFRLTFILSAASAAILNNDSAVLLLIPIVIPLVRSLYPSHPELVVPFALVVFGAAGVAPLIVSNPMNMIVAEYAGIDFNTYAIRMIPIAIVGWVVAMAVYSFIFRKTLAAAADERTRSELPPPWQQPQLQMLFLLLGVLIAYPIVSYLGQPVWSVAAIGAVLSLFLCSRHGKGGPRSVISSGVSWEILAFLVAVSTAAIGLRNAGLVSYLSEAYSNAGLLGIGTISAIGSALINNQPMSLINVLALDASTDGAHLHEIFAALIGGDLGPRLLPWGSLAGLFWYASLRRFDIHVPFRRFVAVGFAVTVPSLLVSLALLHLL